MTQSPDLIHLRYFLAVADELSFRAAAENLNVAQPAVSRGIQQLEAKLGFKLLERTTRHVALTPAGSVLAKQAADAMQLLQRAVRNAGQVAAGTAGEIIVGYSAQAANGVMPEIVVRFRTAFPDAQVGLYSLASDEQIAALQSGRTDLGFLLSNACKAPLQHMVISRERFVLLISKYHPFAARTSVHVSDLADMPFVMGTPKRWASFRSLIDNVCLKAGFLPTVVEETDDVPVLLQLVSLQRGVTLYGTSVVPSLPPDIKAVKIKDVHATFDLSIAWRSDPTPLVREFIALARSRTDRPSTKR
jgi:DNA-binding transcriptional LysR family regulator